MVMLLNISLQEQNLVRDGLEVLKNVQPTWDLSKVKAKVFTDGIMNKLIGYFMEGYSNRMVLVKVYGQNTETMIDRKSEINTMKLLHKLGLGPELYAVFNNGISYEFVPGCTLNSESVRSTEVYPEVAKAMAELHSKVDIIAERVTENDTKSLIWEKLDAFNSLAEDVLRKNTEIAYRISKLKMFPGSAKRQIEELKIILERQNIPIAFCHNDLLLANIIYDNENSKISFIDYEYAMPNYIAFDVANHFVEFAGVENPDFSKCPDSVFKKKWIAEYIRSLTLKDLQLDQSEFERWVESCIPLAHLLWALWSIVQAHNSTIDFDFIEYFRLRYSEYEKHMKSIRIK